MRQVTMLKQVCVIPFRRDYLLKYNESDATALEEIESIDMLRVLESGEKVLMVMTDFDTLSVDTPQDLDRVQVKMMRDDPILLSYLN